MGDVLFGFNYVRLHGPRPGPQYEYNPLLARTEVFCSDLIKNGFEAAGLVLVLFDRVISELNTQLRALFSLRAGVVNQVKILHQKPLLLKNTFIDKLRQSKLFFVQAQEIHIL